MSLLWYGKGSSPETPITQNPGNRRDTVSRLAARGVEKGQHERPLQTCPPAGARCFRASSAHSAGQRQLVLCRLADSLLSSAQSATPP